MQENEIIQGLREGNMGIYEDIVEQYKGYVGTIVMRRISTIMEQEDVEEVVADVFFELWKRRKHLDAKKGTIKNYLGAIARNMSINKLRNRSNTLALEDYLTMQDSASLELQVMSRESMHMLEGEIDKLKDQDKEVFVKYHLNGESIMQISTDMNLSPNTVKSKLARSRKKLRKQLLERGVLYEG